MAQKKSKKLSKLQNNSKRIDSVYSSISKHLHDARGNAVRSINTEMVQAYWLIGRDIVEEEQSGEERAEYGSHLLQEISKRLTKEFGTGFSVRTLIDIRRFYLVYDEINDNKRITHALHAKSNAHNNKQITHALRAQSKGSQRIAHSVRAQSNAHNNKRITHALRAKSKIPTFNSDLSWLHYRLLIKESRVAVRRFYEMETVKNNWSGRELERQMASLLFERLAKSRNKEGLMRLAYKGQEIENPEDVIKDPMILEFLNIPESHKLVETKLEDALIGNMKDFLLELGKGFAFVARQKRLTLDGDHFYADLVFYHTFLKCYVIIDIKTKKLTHGDLGQTLLYTNYFDQEIATPGDNPSIGLILCTEKSDAMVKYTLGSKAKQIFASKYKFALPTEKELEKELKREIKNIKAQVYENKGTA
jgi:predicted nuclease of restriction endonuclease-like (RecB) superfamily